VRVGRVRRQSLGSWGLALSLGLVVWACGGRSQRDLSTNRGGASTGATTGTGGSGAIGGTGAGGAVSNGGDGGDGCFDAGSYHARGSTYPAGDGCSTCTCTPAGSDCSTSTSTCPGGACSTLAREYAVALDRARSCVAGRVGECAGLMPLTLRCGCPTTVNDTRELETLYSAWYSANCDQMAPLPCPACIPLDTLGMFRYCATDGRCAVSEVTRGGAGQNSDAGAAGQ